MGLAIAIVVALITLISTGVFLSHHWWLPHAISTSAPALDRQFTVTFIITGIIFVVAQLARAHDADSKDDIVTMTLGVPVDREVELTMRSKDVTHSFFVRELRLKQDMVPGLEIPIHFMATETGRYEIVCSQLCGLGHYKMRA